MVALCFVVCEVVGKVVDEVSVEVVVGADLNQCSTGNPVRETQLIRLPFSTIVPVSNSCKV